MSNAIFPVLIGREPVSNRIPTFRTKASSSVSFVEARLGLSAYPIWRFSLAYGFLRSAPAYNELNKILSLFLRMGGSANSFLYTDPDDNAVTDFQFATRDGSTTQFQLNRPFDDGAGGVFVEPVQNVNALTNIKDNGVALASPADYTISATGLVTLAVAGVAGHALTWTGSYYWRMRFEADEMDIQKFMYQLFELKKVDLRGSVMNKILP